MGLFTKDKNQNSPSSIDAGNIDFGSTSGSYGMSASEENTGLGLNPIKTSPANNPSLKLSYGIEDTIQLMRTMPDHNDDIVMVVIQKTLESVNVRVKDIIQDAESKEGRIESRVESLIKEINDLSNKIIDRETEITTLRADLTETKSVRESLESVEPKLDPQDETESQLEKVTEGSLPPANDDITDPLSQQESPKSEDENSAIPA